MKKILKSFVLLFLFLSAACSHLTQDDVSVSGDRPVLNMAASSPFAKDQKFYFWGDTPGPTEYIPAWLLTSNDDGSLSSQTVYPYPKQDLDLYGMHGNFSSTITEGQPFPTQALSFKVAEDQTSLAAYGLSDLIYGVKHQVTSSRTPVKIDFYHMLSNVGVVLKAAPGCGLTEDDLKKATVTLKSITISSDFTPQKLSEADMADAATRGKMIAKTIWYGSVKIPTSVVPSTSGFDNAVYGNGIVVPQSGSGTWLEVKLQDGTSFTYTGSYDFKSGNSYQYNVTVSDKLTVECSVTQWWTGGSTDIYSKMCNVGDFFYRAPDGVSWAVSPSDQPIDPTKGTCIGVVVETGRAQVDKCLASYTDRYGHKLLTQHAYVMALTDAYDGSGSLFKWDTSPSPQSVTPQFYDAVVWKGYDYTNWIKAAVGESDLKTKFPACYWATAGYEADSKTQSPLTSTGWYFPSSREFDDLFIGNPQQSLIEASLTKAGGSPLKDGASYWSSTEGPSYGDESKPRNEAFTYDYSKKKTNQYYYSKNDGRRVRPMLVF